VTRRDSPGPAEDRDSTDAPGTWRVVTGAVLVAVASGLIGAALIGLLSLLAE
jgi:hypothetical protein